jgi:glycerol-3-phosphate acyltransferase PlsX
LNYFGNVEGKEVIGGKVDVAVTDGFTGNVMLKSSEAVAKLITDKIREIIKNGSILTKIGGLLVKPALGAIKRLLDPAEQGAAPMLGINGLVFIGHGRSNDFAIKNAIRVAKHAVDVKVLDAMKSAIEESLKK